MRFQLGDKVKVKDIDKVGIITRLNYQYWNTPLERIVVGVTFDKKLFGRLTTLSVDTVNLEKI